MKNLQKTIFLFAFLAISGIVFSQSKTAEGYKICEEEKEIGEGVFLGVRITNCGCSFDGVRVFEVFEGTAAHKMGLLKNDRIKEINGTQMTDPKSTREFVQQHKKGDKVDVKIFRSGKELVLSGELGYEKSEMVTERYICDENFGKLELNNYNAYPNPSRGRFSIEFDTDSRSPIQIRVVDVVGRVIYTDLVENNIGNFRRSIDIEGLQSMGEHLVVVEQDGKVHLSKMVFLR